MSQGTDRKRIETEALIDPEWEKEKSAIEEESCNRGKCTEMRHSGNPMPFLHPLVTGRNYSVQKAN
jgi:hypothetical protein